MRDIILGGLLLPLRLYFRPTAFVDEIAALAPDLPRNYSLWQARDKLRDLAFRRSVTQLMVQTIVAFLWALGLAGIFSMLGYRVDWSTMAFGVAFGVALSVALAVAFGVALAVAFVVAFGVAFGIAFGVAFDLVGVIALCVAVGVVVSAGIAMTLNVGISVGITVRIGVATFVAGVVAGRSEVGVATFVLGVVAGIMAASHLCLFPISSHARKSGYRTLPPCTCTSTLASLSYTLG